jgi:hypothetical protein
MSYSGGIRTGSDILACLVWQGTISVSLVMLITYFCEITDGITIATSVDVERVFSRSRLLLSHIRNRLSAQTTRSLLCLGYWSRLGLIQDKDVTAVAKLPEIPGDDDVELDDG